VTSLEGFECGTADRHERRSDRVSVCQSVTVNPLGSLSDRARNGHVLSQAGSDPQLADVGELDLAVLPPATFSKSHNELRCLLSITLEQECYVGGTRGCFACNATRRNDSPVLDQFVIGW
jgi:hypothetical protein